MRSIASTLRVCGAAATLALAGLAAGASAQAVLAAAGAPVSKIRFAYLRGGQRLDGRHVLIHAWPTAAWLPTVSPGCQGLDRSRYFSLRQRGSRRVLAVQVDGIKVNTTPRNDYCPIASIQPVDLAALPPAWRNPSHDN